MVGTGSAYRRTRLRLDGTLQVSKGIIVALELGSLNTPRTVQSYRVPGKEKPQGQMGRARGRENKTWIQVKQAKQDLEKGPNANQVLQQHSFDPKRRCACIPPYPVHGSAPKQRAMRSLEAETTSPSPSTSMSPSRINRTSSPFHTSGSCFRAAEHDAHRRALARRDPRRSHGSG